MGLFVLLLSAGCARKIIATNTETLPRVNTESNTHGPAVSFKENSVKDTIIQAEINNVQTEINKEPVARIVYTPAGKYTKANQLYFEMIDSLTKVISEYPVQDSSGLSYAPEIGRAHV